MYSSEKMRKHPKGEHDQAVKGDVFIGGQNRVHPKSCDLPAKAPGNLFTCRKVARTLRSASYPAALSRSEEYDSPSVWGDRTTGYGYPSAMTNQTHYVIRYIGNVSHDFKP